MNESIPPYIVKRTARSRHVRVSVSAGGKVTVSAPPSVRAGFIETFLRSKLSWLLEKVEYFKKVPEPLITARQDKKLYKAEKERALQYALGKVVAWNKVFGFKVGRVSIRNSKTRWGSCSSKGTLSFNYKIVFLPEPVADYLVVHELCHLKEANHSEAFWSLVKRVIPEYQTRRKELRDFHKTFKLPNSLV